MPTTVRHRLEILAGVLLLALLTTSLTTVHAPQTAQATGGSTDVMLLEAGSTGWKYKQMPLGANESNAEEAQPATLKWRTGEAPFGTRDPVSCIFNDPELVKTQWNANTKMLITRKITVPPGTTALHFLGSVDDEFHLYVNGHIVVQGFQNVPCERNYINVHLTNPLYFGDVGANAVVFIRAIDHGGASFLDLQVTATVQHTNYMALGDSYTSGEGNKPFDKGTGQRGGCHRSKASWARQLEFKGAFELLPKGHIACSGAVLVCDKKGEDRKKCKVLSTQIKALMALKVKPDVVVLSIGGNDAGFGKVGSSCYTPKGKCLPAVADTLKKADEVLPKRLRTGLTSVHRASPKAKIVIVGYPHIVSPQKEARKRCVWLSANEQEALQKIAPALEASIKGVVTEEAKKYNISYVSTLNSLSGHQLCDKKSWVKQISLITGKLDSTAAHPLKEGQTQMMLAVHKAIRERL